MSKPDEMMNIIEAAYNCAYSMEEIHKQIADAGLPQTSDETIHNLLGMYGERIKNARIADILERALQLLIKEIQINPYMCNHVSDLYVQGEISFEERTDTRAVISKAIDYEGTLSTYLRINGKLNKHHSIYGAEYLAMAVEFYTDLIKQLRETKE